MYIEIHIVQCMYKDVCIYVRTYSERTPGFINRTPGFINRTLVSVLNATFVYMYLTVLIEAAQVMLCCVVFHLTTFLTSSSIHELKTPLYLIWPNGVRIKEYLLYVLHLNTKVSQN